MFEMRWNRCIGAIILLFSSLFLTSAAVFAQSAQGAATGARASISGHISDASNAVIQSARVVVAPADLVVTSDSLGDFVVTGLAPGNYTVSVTSAGFKQLVQSVTITAGQTVPLDLILQVALGSEEVVVSGGSGQDMVQAVNEEITSPDIVNVMPETEILALPNANIADAVGRLPGVTVQRDEGEAVYVQVRGFDPRLTNTTIDGVTIPSPEPMCSRSCSQPFLLTWCNRSS
jgi:hypothetical protein